MRDKLRRAIPDPYFKLTLMIGINGLIDSARHLISIGIDVNPIISEAVREINLQLSAAAYEITDLDALLQDAQAIGDEIVKTEQTEEGFVTPTTTETDDDSS
jgi:hypothetical protein